MCLAEYAIRLQHFSKTVWIVHSHTFHPLRKNHNVMSDFWAIILFKPYFVESFRESSIIIFITRRCVLAVLYYVCVKLKRSVCNMSPTNAIILKTWSLFTKVSMKGSNQDMLNIYVFALLSLYKLLHVLLRIVIGWSSSSSSPSTLSSSSSSSSSSSTSSCLWYIWECIGSSSFYMTYIGIILILQVNLLIDLCRNCKV